MSTKQELGFALGQAAVECANAAAHFCFNKIETSRYGELLEQAAAKYVLAVQALEAFVLDEEEEAQSVQGIRQSGESSNVPNGTDSGT